MENSAEPRGMPLATGIFLAANALVYLGLVVAEGGLDMSTRTIAAWGGLVPLEWLDGQYWRMLTAGFLHFGLMHLVANAICLIAWGVPLERGLGPSRMVILFLGSILAGSIGSLFLHSEPFISAGASGGASGLLGALFAFWLLRDIALPASFFAINIGLNIAVTIFVPGIDWQAHLGGFAGGAILALILRPRMA
ncbi:MAG: rhomboid family intramembrane serine protease [Rhabdaerophilum sp.]